MDEYLIKEAVKKMRFNMVDEKRLWSDEERRILKVRFENGYGISEIVVELGRSEGAVYQQIKAMGLYPDVKKRVHLKKIICDEECLCNVCNKLDVCKYMKQ